MPDATVLTLLFILPFAGCLLTAFFPSNTRNIEAWIAGAVALGGLVLTISLYPSIAGGGSVRAEAEWLPALGIGVTIRMDGLAWMFALLVTGIGLLVMIYARYYMSPDDSVVRFFSVLLGFMGSMLGIVLAGDLIQLAFFWELTSLFSFQIGRASCRERVCQYV